MTREEAGRSFAALRMTAVTAGDGDLVVRSVVFSRLSPGVKSKPIKGC
jgi:hypothetical protein